METGEEPNEPSSGGDSWRRWNSRRSSPLGSIAGYFSNAMACVFTRLGEVIPSCKDSEESGRGSVAPAGPHPAFGHLLPLRREKALGMSFPLSRYIAPFPSSERRLRGYCAATVFRSRSD